MKSKEVLKLLGISRVTLSHYVTNGKLKVTKLHNGYYDYDKDSVFKLLKKEYRFNVIYGRVSTYKQKNDLDTQIKKLVDFCSFNNIIYSKIYKDIASGINLDRKEFDKLLTDIINYKVANVYITYKDRLTRLSFSTIESLFKKFGTSIIVINEKDDDYDNEIFEELITLIHLFSTKMYSNRRKKKLKIINKDLLLFNTST